MMTASDSTKSWRASIFLEVLVLWLVVNLLIRGILMIQNLGVHEFVLVAVPVLFMYAPVVSCWWRGDDSNRYPITLPGIRNQSKVWSDAFRFSGLFVLLTTPPFLIVYHLWHTYVLGHSQTGAIPDDFLMIIGYHLFFVGIPEEFFYRGYIQTRLDQLWGTRWKLLGASVGPGLLVTCFLFAFGHSIVVFQWWHVAIFIPSLAFGWLRAKTGDVMAGALFHAYCNIMVMFLDTFYGATLP